MTVRLGASCSAHSFNILFGMLSGPEAFDGFTLDSSFFLTPSVLILIGLMLFFDVFVTSGRGPGVSFAKTDWNCFTRISAFPLILMGRFRKSPAF